MTDHYYDPEFHVISNTKDPSSFFASFSVFKNSSKSVLRYEERPPYPILTNKPTLRELLYNINKADVVLYFGIMGTGLATSIFSLRIANTLYLKFFMTQTYMHCFNVLGLYLMLQCSYYRLTGMMDNGLRWKHKEDTLKKYDFTREFEEKTIFKYFRERPDE